MAESYFDLPPDEAVRILENANRQSGQVGMFLEKDIWSVWCLQTLFNAPFGKFLIFKGGTSLSKAYGLIQRFSEDIDIACDIRQFMPDLEIGDYDHLPRSSSQGSTMARTVKKRMYRWMDKEAIPFLESKLKEVDPGGYIERKSNMFFVHYTPRTKPLGYVNHEVKLEFYPRSTGEPCKPMPIACDIANYVSGVDFPATSLRVLAAERTFWEKASAMHVLCKRGRTRGKRFARHLYDLVCLDRAGVADSAMNDRKLAVAVAEHNDRFRKEKYGTVIDLIVDYHETYNGNLLLVPDDESVRKELYQDYQYMIDISMFSGEPPSFALILDECKKLESRINSRALAAARD